MEYSHLEEQTQLLVCAALLAFYPDSARFVTYGRYGDMIGAETSGRVSARDSRDRVHVVYSYNWGSPIAESSEIFHRFSTDNGLTWSEPIRVSRNGDMLSTDPSLAIDSQDRLHCVWFECWDTTPPLASFDFFYSCYENDSWTTPVNISRTATFSNIAEQSCVAVDNQDRVHVAYEIGGMGSPDVYYTAKLGDTWSLPERVSVSSRDDGFPSLGADQQDQLHLCWRLKGPPWHMMYSHRNGAWSYPECIATYYDGVGNPSLAVGPDDRVHLVFDGSSGADTGEIYYMCRTGDVWSQPLNISNSYVKSVLPCVAVDSSGCIYTAWTELPVDSMCQLFYRVYDGEWRPIQNLTNDTARGSASPRFGLQVTSERLDLFWRCWEPDTWPGIYSLYYMRLKPIVLGAAEEDVRTGPWMSVRPVPFRDRLIVTVAGPVRDAKVFDRCGRVVRRLEAVTDASGISEFVWDGRDTSGVAAPAGVYIIRIATTSTITRTLVVKQ